MPPRVRTVRECVALFRHGDPDTAVTEHYLRRLIKSGKINVIWAGNRALLNYDALCEFLAKGEPPNANSTQQGGMRPIDPRRVRL